MDIIAVFIAHYSIGNSPSIINLLSLLSDHYQVHLFLNQVSHKNTPVLGKPNITIFDNVDQLSLETIRHHVTVRSISYQHFICIDPHGFVLCKDIFPDSKPLYYSLELYLKDDHYGLYYPQEVMRKERNQINSIRGLIIQSRKKEKLFRRDYCISDSIPTFILPVTYAGPPISEKSKYIRNKYQIPEYKKIILHLGSIAEWFSCIELADTISALEDFILFFHGYPSVEYLSKFKQYLSQKKIKNVIISNETFDNIDDVDRIIMSCDIGIAWYNNISAGFRMAGRSSGKIAAYLRFGLPIISKKYASTLEAIDDTGCGISVDDFLEIPLALSKIQENYSEYTENALREYQHTYWFERYKKRLLRFVKTTQVSNIIVRSGIVQTFIATSQDLINASRNHFNWDKLMKGKNIEDFLSSPELWGAGQGPDNPGRIAWRQYLETKSADKQIRVLEVGFGSGIDYKTLESTGILDTGQIEYYGVDVTEAFVDYAQKHFHKMKSFLIDGYHLPFDNNYFDVVYLRHVLEHQTHYKDLLSEVFRVCRGEVFIIFFIELSDSESDSINFDGTWYHNKYSRKLFQEFVNKHGFELNQLAIYRTGDKTDQIFLCVRQSQFNDQKSTNEKSSKQKARNLHILHTVEFYYPHIGGSEMVVQQISERLAKRGHRVEVATTRLPERNFKELNGVTIHEFDVAGNLAVGVRGRDFHRYQEFLINHPANVMMNYAAQQWATDLAFFALEATQNKRVNVIVPCGYSALEDARTLRWPQFADYFGKIIPVVIPYYDAAIYHSSMYKDYEFAQIHGFQNSIIIPNGVDEEEFSQKIKVDFREKYNIKTPFMGLCVANFYNGKGHDRVIEAVRQMNRKDFTMVFIGKEGEELEFLRKKASGLNIMFLVNIPREDTVAAFHTADIFLFGSYIEASPLVIIEAKASKTPFVSTDCGNVKEWKGGIVCSAEEMAENANKILDDGSLRKRLSEEGYKEWKEKLTWESVVDKYEDLYLRLYQEKFGKKKEVVSPPVTVLNKNEEKTLLEKLYKDFRNVPSLIRLAEIELERLNQKKAQKYILAALALEPQNITAKTLWEKLQQG